MKTRSEAENWSLMQSMKHAAAGAIALLLLLPVAAWSGGVVTNCTEANLRAAMAGGGDVTFACDGIITLTNPITVLNNTLLDAAGHLIVLSGGDSVRCFQVGANVAFTLANLTIANGRSTNGGGLYNAGGVVTATNCTFSGNAARQNIYTPAASLGGAIFSLGGELFLQRCLFTNNSAEGGVQSANYPIGCDGGGGAVFSAGSLSASNCSFVQNAAGGGNVIPNTDGYHGGAARGGAIYSTGWMLLDANLFATNSATGGSGGDGAAGSIIPPYSAGGYGGAGGGAYGGALCSPGAAQIANCTLVGNRTAGGIAGKGGDGSWGGEAGLAGDAYGGALWSTGLAQVVNCTLVGNQAMGGRGGNGGNGSPPGHPGGGGDAAGAIWSELVSGLSLINCTVADNMAYPGPGGQTPPYVAPNGSAVGGLGGQTIQLINTLLATNYPGNASNILIDLGHNLSSDNSAALPGAGSLTNIDPRLGPLADNGGPTLTMELLPDSPAIDAGDTASAPAYDQRGVVRPVGVAADIGAYEFEPRPPAILTPPASQTAPIGTDVEFTVEATGSPPLNYQWVFNLTNILSDGTNSVLRLTNVQPVHAGDYCVVITNLFGTITSPPALLIAVGIPPSLVISPLNQTVALDSTVTFLAAATGSLPLTYQWFFNATNELSHATNAVLTLTSVQLADSGIYSIRAANAFGAVTSAPAMLVLFGVPPAIVASPRNQAAVLGAGVDFSVSASGSSPLRYQWFFNGTTVLGGATGSGVHLEAVEFAQAGLYAAVVTNDFGSATSSPALLTVTPPGTTAVANPTDAEFRAAMAGGGIVTFACDGTITLTNPITVLSNTVLDGAGHSIVLSGGSSVRCFLVSSNITFTLANLTITSGLSTNGGGLLNAGGTVNASNCVFSGNLASGPAGSSVGEHGTPAAGGAVYNTGSFLARQCAFLLNQAAGGRGADGNPVATVTPPPGGIGASGSGGALCNLGTMILEGCLLASNSVSGGNGGRGSAGDYYISPSSNATPGGRGGAGAGGALHNGGTAALLNCTLAWNQGSGGSGGTGGTMRGPWPPVLWGSSGGKGGDGIGGIYGTNGLLSLTNCTVSSNSGNGGLGGSGGACTLQGHGGAGGGGVGGGFAELQPANLVNCLLALNTGTDGSGGYGCINFDKYHPLFGYGPTGYSDGNLRGALNDLGHNLSSDGSAGLTNVTSLNNTDPKLGPLANNGGPTLTMALLPGSPAIDAGDNAAAPATDQRGIPRPVGSYCDIGACEFTAVLQISLGPDSEVSVLVYGPSNQWCRLLMSSNLSDWQCVATNQIGPNGTVLFQDNCGTGETQRFYQVVLP